VNRCCTSGACTPPFLLIIKCRKCPGLQKKKHLRTVAATEVFRCAHAGRHVRPGPDSDDDKTHRYLVYVRSRAGDQSHYIVACVRRFDRSGSSTGRFTPPSSGRSRPTCAPNFCHVLTRCPEMNDWDFSGVRGRTLAAASQ
jgi:hypothetical protein